MKRFVNDIKKYYNYMVRAAKSALKTEVANSYLNWIWWILDPLLNMFVYYLLFGIVFDGKEPHFTTFIFIGLTMWNFFNKNVVQSVNMVKRNKPIVSKVYVPKFVLLLSNMMVNEFKMLISWVIVALMMLLSGIHVSLYILWFIPIMISFNFVTFAVCIYCEHFGVFVEDLANVINIAFKLLFYMTGVFYSIDNRIHVKWMHDILIYCNPVALMLQDMRNVLLYQQAPSYVPLLIWTTIGVVFSILGVRKVYRYENSYVKVI